MPPLGHPTLKADHSLLKKKKKSQSLPTQTVRPKFPDRCLKSSSVTGLGSVGKAAGLPHESSQEARYYRNFKPA